MNQSRRFWQFIKSGCIGVCATAAMLAPMKAVALDFRFFFNPSGLSSIQQLNQDGIYTVDYEVEGLITGLNDNQQGTSPLRLEILKSRNDPLAIGTYSFVGGAGFSVVEGQISTVDWVGVLDSQEHYRRLSFFEDNWRMSLWATLKDFPPSPPSPSLPPWSPDPVWVEGVGYVWPMCFCGTTTMPEYNIGSMPIFVPASQDPGNLTPPFIRSTPGPLPILGAVAAYNCSRRLRRRIRQAGTVGEIPLIS